MFGLGTTELIVIGAIVFLIFGAKRLPEIGKGLGGAVKELKQVKKDISHEDSPPETKDEVNSEGKKDQPSMENKLAGKVVEQIPGVKKAMDVKKKVDKVKDIIK